MIYKFLFYLALMVIEYLATTSVHIKVIESIWDKANHFIAFFTLYILFSLSYKDLKTLIKVILLLLFGIQIEIVQYFLPYRDFSLLDVIADFIGIILGVLVYDIINIKKVLGNNP